MDTMLRQSTAPIGIPAEVKRQESLMVCLQDTVQMLNEVAERLDQMNIHLIGPRPTESVSPCPPPASLMQWAEMARTRARHIANETVAMQSVL